MTETPESPADTMRRAARLMRERAALVPPPPWRTSVRGVTTHSGGDVIADTGVVARSDYLAAMHPGVALALAAWLEFEAVNAPEIGEPVFRGGRPVYALAVAAAYLGEQSILGEPV